MTWTYGDTILLRYLNRGRISHVVAATVVEDSPDLIALYVAMNSPMKIKVGLDGTRIPRSLPYPERFGKPWKLADGTWSERSVLWLTKPGMPYAIGVFWAGTERLFAGLYCNIQDPLQRHALGFDSVDHVLDVQFWPDGTWSWKDEDEFEDAQLVGRFTPESAATVREAGETAIKAWKQKAWPFDSDWATWEPDGSWSIPAIPTNWDQLF
jgi:hypothetical protein